VAAGVLVAVAVMVGVLAPAPAKAADPTQFCLNGVTYTEPVGIFFEGEYLFSFDVGDAAFLQDVAIPPGVFYVGYIEGELGAWISEPGIEAALAPGWDVYYTSLGACAEPGITHVGVCKMLLRGDGTTGMFQVIPLAQWNDTTSAYYDAPAANWVEGMGLTCDNPIALGYKDAGYKVAWGGKPAPNNDPKGLRGSGNNNIYPYFTK
jgi:hypothetical protein